MEFLRGFYRMSLRLYPKNYREEYAEELHTVFDLSLEDALGSGRMEFIVTLLRELLSLPKAIIYEHLRERRRRPMIKKFSAYFNFEYGSSREFFSAMFPFFLLGGFLPLMNILTRSGWLVAQSRLVNGIGIVSVGLLGLLFLSGLVSGLPRWSLPYLGFLLSLISVYGFPQLLDRWWRASYQPLYDKSWLLGQIGYQGSLWIGLTVATILLVLLIGSIPALRRFKNDWTLLPFTLYGVTPFALVATFDDYVNEEPYELLAFLVLFAGAWIYLHSDNPRLRFLSLFGGLTVSLFIAAVAKAIIFSSPSWPYPHQSFSWQNEMMSTVIMWMWIALSMLVSLVLILYPRSNDSLQAA